MKLFGFFGKSSDDDQGTSSEDSIPSELSEATDEPQQAPEPQSQAAVDRGATMSDVIKAVTDQFALINADSDADLRAVGAALCQIPEGMSPLSAGFSSFRHEVLHAILITGEEDGLAERAVVLNKCLTSIEDSPDLAEQGAVLRFLAQELQEGMLAADSAANNNGDAEAQVNPAMQSTPTSQGGDGSVENSDSESAERPSAMSAQKTASGSDDSDGDDAEPRQEFVPSEPVLEVIESPEIETQESLEGHADSDPVDEVSSVPEAAEREPQQQLIGKLAHADQLIASVGEARAGIQSERASDTAEHFGEYSDDLREFIVALSGVTSSCLQALDGCFARELDTLSHYRNVCAELEQGATRSADLRRCITFIDAGLRGEPVADDLSGTENEWLGSLSNELASVSKEQSAIAAEKGQQIKGQIAEIQLEADQANELIKKLGAETLEPPATVLQSLTSSDFASEDADTEPEVDYEDSIDQYIEWMKRQREAIRDQRKRIEELDQKMADAEREADRQYSGRLEPVQRRKEELTRNLEDALHSANKDAEETEARLDVLTQDASTLIGEYMVAVDKRAALAANVEDAMASAMIRLGKVLDEANMISAADGRGDARR
ncbi:MAG: hypothetical protein CL580_04990 [Alteromonadaceae bacterium]|nr:hypothetical protein [Alteromonadaceae bacterium]